ncbi:ABC transporter permease [Galbibacter sp. EGI 63066]|uniref:ABC transporter permease n=1 Tax=Galbibacter sp. EGI 63066 TaxID=2993559 RepID=UPI002248A8A3|nr:ABC transporter permease [Galbibacter sp. EGI 63066]MCX2678332.1 ABC transporter permease [Galbibacter sp. EGI 63066]
MNKNRVSIDITKFLPHRKPFLMVDNILFLDEEQVMTSFHVKTDCIFIDNDCFSETGLIENAAQTCSAIVGKSYYDNDCEVKLVGFISTIKKISVFKCPEVGTTITSKAVLNSRYDTEEYSICTLQCNIFDDLTTELLSCEMNLFIQKSA